MTCLCNHERNAHGDGTFSEWCLVTDCHCLGFVKRELSDPVCVCTHERGAHEGKCKQIVIDGNCEATECLCGEYRVPTGAPTGRLIDMVNLDATMKEFLTTTAELMTANFNHEVRVREAEKAYTEKEELRFKAIGLWSKMKQYHEAAICPKS